MATVSRDMMAEILDEVFDENLIDFVGKKALVTLRNTVLDRMEEAGMVEAPQEQFEDEDEDDLADDYEYEDDYDDFEDD